MASCVLVSVRIDVRTFRRMLNAASDSFLLHPHSLGLSVSASDHSCQGKSCFSLKCRLAKAAPPWWGHLNSRTHGDSVILTAPASSGCNWLNQPHPWWAPLWNEDCFCNSKPQRPYSPLLSLSGQRWQSRRETCWTKQKLTYTHAVF